ncbi:hypothetical protein MVES_002658 [Malassezia vespertilionis]|uniref:C2 domain-containing protein n=1 Tax=Malassezia vespertilionis TaxID=2020962 RepID=A0A2N1JAF0_9BASI|nr:hypothetical protein MVES_002658 [Malassezia vespertilionis]
MHSPAARHCGTLVCVVLKARNLHSTSAYARVSLGDTIHETALDAQHHWDEQFQFEVYDHAATAPARMHVACYTDNHVMIGEASIALDAVLARGEYDCWAQLAHHARCMGEVYMELTFYARQASRSVSARQESVSGAERSGNRSVSLSQEVHVPTALRPSRVVSPTLYTPPFAQSASQGSPRGTQGSPRGTQGSPRGTQSPQHGSMGAWAWALGWAWGWGSATEGRAEAAEAAATAPATEATAAAEESAAATAEERFTPDTSSPREPSVPQGSPRTESSRSQDPLWHIPSPRLSPQSHSPPLPPRRAVPTTPPRTARYSPPPPPRRASTLAFSPQRSALPPPSGISASTSMSALCTPPQPCSTAQVHAPSPLQRRVFPDLPPLPPPQHPRAASYTPCPAPTL